MGGSVGGAGARLERSVGRRVRGVRWSVVLAFVVPIGILIFGAWQRRWISDDGYINLRVVSQIDAGNGPVFNAGERVEVGTSPLWIGVIALLHVVLGWVQLAWIAVVGGITLMVIGVVAGTAGSLRAVRARWGDVDVLPAGVLVFVVLSPVWDFASSGLETGLTFAWLGSSFLVLVTWARRSMDVGDRPRRLAWWSCVLLGLGPLIRPDFTILTVGFLVAALRINRPEGLAKSLRMIAWALALPVLYQVFRMGYYASLVPNTALAKGAASLRPAQGLQYVNDFVVPYGLPIMVVLLVLVARVPAPATPRALRTLFTTVWVSAATLAAYYVLIGGDFMHARFLLPSFFLALLPVAVVPVPRSSAVTRQRIAFGLLVAWCLVAMLVLRPRQFGSGLFIADIDDERSDWVGLTQNDTPVTPDDWANSTLARTGASWRARSDAGDRRLVLLDGTELPTPAGLFIGDTRNIGILSYLAGPDVHVVDLEGLGDPIAARTARPGQWNPGHPPPLPESWVVARYAPDDVTAYGAEQEQASLACPQVVRLLDDISGPLSLGEFWHNILQSPEDTRLTIDASTGEGCQRDG